MTSHHCEKPLWTAAPVDPFLNGLHQCQHHGDLQQRAQQGGHRLVGAGAKDGCTSVISEKNGGCFRVISEKFWEKM